MSLERDLSVGVKSVVEHIKNVVQRNLTIAVNQGKITIDKDKLQGLILLVHRSIDQGFDTGYTGFNSVVKQVTKAMKEAEEKGVEKNSKLKKK